MKFTIKKTDAVKALSKINGIVESSTKIPILSNIAITATGKSLNFCVTDMEISATIDCPAEVSEDGEITIPAARFFDICKNASGETISVEISGDRATVKSGKSRFTLGTLPIAGFPAFQPSPAAAGFAIDAGFLLKLMDDTAGSSSGEESRHYLRGVYLHEKDGKLLAVATDGHRLASSSGDAETPFKAAIIPDKAVAVLQKILSGYEGDVTFESKGNKIQIIAGNLTVSSKVIDGQFPDYERVCPKTYEGKFTIDTDAAIKSIERVSTVEDKTNSTKITLKDNTATFERWGSGEDSLDQIDAVYDGDGFSITADSILIMSALKRIKTGRTVVQFNTVDTPMLFTAENDDTASWLIMPMRGR